MIVPAEIGREAAIADGPVVYGGSSLAEAVEVLEGSVRIHPMWSMSPTCSNQEAVARWISPRCGSDVSRPHR